MSAPVPPIPTLSRRELLRRVSAGFGHLAFASLAAAEASPGAAGAVPAPHHPPRARRVIFLCMQGGPSQLDTFDPKPRLQRDAGRTLRGRGRVVGSPLAFRQHGRSGLWISELFPNVARHADALCVVRSLHTDIPNHPQAFIQLHTGSAQFVRQSLGAWTMYGLGSENRDLPGFITINPPAGLGGAQNYGSAFLPATHQGTRLQLAGGRRGEAGTMDNLRNGRLDARQQRAQLDLIQQMNRSLRDGPSAQPEVEGLIASYELAFRMQAEVPRMLDLSGESAATLEAYGVGQDATDGFARQCLLARRFAEAGVRFIEVQHGGWDQHNNLESALRRNCRATDQPIAALLTDLRERGLLDDTLVLWGGEFGRTPDNGQEDGRGHNAKGYTMWMAGGGVRGGMAHGATDDLGAEAVEDKVHLHDLHATLLHLLGLDHERLTYRYAGRDFRLTDVHGHVVQGIIG